MVTAPVAECFNGSSWFQKIANLPGSILTRLCERTETAFRRVHVMKRDEQGHIKLYDKKDPLTGAVRKDALLNYIEDVRTGELYLDEPTYVVAVKCAVITLGMPLYAFGRMTWNLVKTPIEIGTIALDAIRQLSTQLRQCHLKESASTLKTAVIQSTAAFGHGLYEIVKAPLFMLGCELAAIYGIFRPYHGRKYEAILEHFWQRGVSYKNDFVSIPARPGESCWEAFRKDIMNAHTCYLARCFQVRGNVNESRVVVIKREPI